MLCPELLGTHGAALQRHESTWLPGLVILSLLLFLCTSVFLLGPAETGNKRVKIPSLGFVLAVILTLCRDGKGSHSFQARETPSALDAFQRGAQGQVLRSLSVGLDCVSRSLFK